MAPGLVIPLVGEQHEQVLRVADLVAMVGQVQPAAVAAG
jgi:hypothetical protein